MRLEPWHIVVLLAVVVLLFGANRLPSLAKAVGQSLKIFKDEVKDLTDENGSADTKNDRLASEGPDTTKA